MSSIQSRFETGRGIDWSVPAVLERIVWTAFIISSGFAVWYALFGQPIRVGSVIAIDGLTAVMWVAVTFFSGIVHSYSRRYMAADPNLRRFFCSVFLITLAVGVMTAANHIALFVLAWGAMGWFMANLIGHAREWPQAQVAGTHARWSFLAGTGLITAGLGLLWQHTGETTITGIVSNLGQLSGLHVGASILLIIAATIQSSLFPFHRWLLSSMTAPTPASAIMHAGFVNAGGVLLTRFAPVFAQSSTLMICITVIGATSALLGQLCMLAQTDIKSRLGCSTVAQMGFMILQCGLGFFAAAITHLIIHGFYKAYQFLSAGSRIDQISPERYYSQHTSEFPAAARVLILLVTAIGGGLVFAALTGKDLTTSNTGWLLIAVVALSGLRAAKSLLDKDALAPTIRAIGVPVVMLPAVSLYALVYNAISTTMHGLPMSHVTLELTTVHWVVLGTFALMQFALLAGWHRQSRSLYTFALNAAQPLSESVLSDRGDYSEY